MTKVDLASGKAKLRWAREHRDRLHGYIDKAFKDPTAWALLSADLEPDTGEHIFRITAVPDYSTVIEAISLHVGDIVHGLRGALDHLAWQLACAHGPMTEQQERAIQFPIHDDPAKFRGNRTAGCYEPADWARVETYQPFLGLNGRSDSYSGAYVHQLAHLQELSNTDKHRQLSLVLLTSSRFSTIPVEGGHPPWLVKRAGQWTMDVEKINEPNPYAAPPNFDHTSYLVEIGAEVVRYRMTSEHAQRVSIEEAGAVMPSVALVERRPLMATLDRIADYVELVLGEFEDELRQSGRLAS
ncbi:hypothetical protein [Actinoplanes sp. NPDC049316]|uniref:hypothetical protein n=1 Tax=Actinoplanes sp. NPDC049316 TaxID=3154727 RepID=UPI003413C8F0